MAAQGSNRPHAVVVLVGRNGVQPLWQIGPQVPLDLALVDALARLQLIAGRAGMSIRLHRPQRGLSQLLELAGLADVIPGVDSVAADREGRAGMFVQVINAMAPDTDAIRGQMERWAADLRPAARGFLGSTAGVAADGSFVAVARFESEEAARANSERPEQGAWWAETERCLQEPITFHDCREATILAAGGSEEAGFVQVVQGRALDKALLNRLEIEIHQWFPDLRPDFIGSLLVWDGDWFSVVAYFTSEEEARQGEQRLAASDKAAEFQQWLDAISDVTYIDLRDPWLWS